MITDIGFSVVRDWVLGNSPLSPGSFTAGEWSGAPLFSDTALGSPLEGTDAGFSSTESFSQKARLEYLIESGDTLPAGSVIRELGLFNNGDMLWRDVIPDITMTGSIEINSVLDIIID